MPELAGVSQALANKLRGAPREIKEHYKTMKHAKSVSCEDKEAVVKDVFSNDNWNSSTF